MFVEGSVWVQRCSSRPHPCHGDHCVLEGNLRPGPLTHPILVLLVVDDMPEAVLGHCGWIAVIANEYLREIPMRCLAVQTAHFRTAEGHHQLHPPCLTPIFRVIDQSPEEVGYSGRKGSDGCLKIAGQFWPRWHCTSLYAV